MKTIPIRLNYDYPGMTKVVISNEMAPLTISNAEGGKIEIEADLLLSERNADLHFERYFDVSFEHGTVSIDLEEIPELEDGFMRGGQSRVKVLIPAGVELEADTENLPLQLSEFKGTMTVENMNGPIVISDCEGRVKVENENGPVKMHNCTGDLTLTQENGPFSAERISGDILKVETENGAVKIRSASYHKADVKSENGMIYYESMPIDAGELEFESENGQVSLVLPEDFDFELVAESELGMVKCNLKAEIQRDEGSYVIRQGEGKTKIRIKTENGVIKIVSDAYMNLGFLKQKLNELREAIKNTKTLEDQQKVQVLLEKIIAGMEKASEKISEARIKESIMKGVETLKSTVEGVDLNETKDKVIAGVEKIGDEIANGFREFIVKMKYSDEEKHEQRHDRFERGILKEHIRNVVDAAFAKAGSKGLSGRERQEVDDRSRIKILEMLESGKITAEEAERLLKAIGKE